MTRRTWFPKKFGEFVSWSSGLLIFRGMIGGAGVQEIYLNTVPAPAYESFYHFEIGIRLVLGAFVGGLVALLLSIGIAVVIAPLISWALESGAALRVYLATSMLTAVTFLVFNMNWDSRFDSRYLHNGAFVSLLAFNVASSIAIECFALWRVLRVPPPKVAEPGPDLDFKKADRTLAEVLEWNRAVPDPAQRFERPGRDAPLESDRAARSSVAQ